MLMPKSDHPARLHFMPYSFRVLSPGDYVLCAVSDKRISLDNLRYWSVERQEPYASAEYSVQAEIKSRAARGLFS